MRIESGALNWCESRRFTPGPFGHPAIITQDNKMGKKGMKGFMKAAQRPGGKDDDDEEEEPQTAAASTSKPASHDQAADKKETVLKNDENDEDEEDGEESGGPETRPKMLKRHQREMQAHKKALQRAGKKSKEELAKMNKEIEDRHAKELKTLESAASLPPTVPAQVLQAPEPLMAKLTLSGPDSDPQLKTKAMKRREKLERDEAERAARIAEETSNMGPSNKLLEEERLQQLLLPLGLSMKEIKADGNCLFRSIEDQMAATAEGPVVMTHTELRKAAADYILSHPSDFMPYIFDEDEKGDEEAQLKAYADTMASTAAWGGQCELVAIAEVLSRPIEVHAVGMPLLTLGEQHKGKSPLRVCYLRSAFALGEHYNSCVQLPP
jgi:OTU domain-containing protein 6